MATGCDQVVLGVHDGHCARALAISHIDRFERNAENVQLLEAALDEAFDQGVDIVYPPAPAGPAAGTVDASGHDATGMAAGTNAALQRDTGLVTLCHDPLARAVGHAHLASLLLDGGEPEAPRLALLLGRRDGALSADRLQQVSVALHLLRPWLADRRERALGPWDRLALGARRRVRRWTQPGQGSGLWLGGATVLLGFSPRLRRAPCRPSVESAAGGVAGAGARQDHEGVGLGVKRSRSFDTHFHRAFPGIAAPGRNLKFCRKQAPPHSRRAAVDRIRRWASK